MTRRLLTVLVSMVLVVVSLLGGRVLKTVQASPAPKTQVCGKITTSAEWTTASSPYEVTCDVPVPAGVTLTVDPGVIVDFDNGTRLQVLGTLLANGTSSQGITFQPTSTTATSTTCQGQNYSNEYWCGVQFVSGASTSTSVTYATFDGATTDLVGYPGAIISNDTFEYSTTGIEFGDSGQQATLTTKNNDFAYDYQGINSQANLRTSNDTFIHSSSTAINVGGGTVFAEDDSISIDNPYEAAINAYSGEINSTSVTGAGIGVKIQKSLSMKNSTIADNIIGISLNGGSLGTHINNNDIENNNQYNLSITAPNNRDQTVDATSNYWGTTDASAIARSIHDCNQDLTLACVDSGSPLMSSPTNLTFPTNTPTTRTPTPSSTTTITSTPTMTSTPTVTSTPTSTPIPDTPTPSASPQVELSRLSVQAGDSNGVTVTGGGFTGSDTIGVSFLANLVGGGQSVVSTSVQAFDNGTFVLANWVVPGNVAPGTYPLTARDESTGVSAATQLQTTAAATATPTSTATATYTPTPTRTPVPVTSSSATTATTGINLNPSQVQAGTPVSVAGAGFMASETVTASYTAVLTSGQSVVESASVVAFSNGTFLLLALPVPANVVPGVYAVHVTGSVSSMSGVGALSVTAAPQATPTPTVTPQPTATPTNTATAIPTPTNTSVPVTPAIAITHVQVQEMVNHVPYDTRSIPQTRKATFVLAYTAVNPSDVPLAGSVTLTLRGKSMGNFTMNALTTAGGSEFRRTVDLRKHHLLGQMYVHFHVVMGSVTAQRDRKLSITKS